MIKEKDVLLKKLCNISYLELNLEAVERFLKNFYFFLCLGLDRYKLEKALDILIWFHL